MNRIFKITLMLLLFFSFESSFFSALAGAATLSAQQIQILTTQGINQDYIRSLTAFFGNCEYLGRPVSAERVSSFVDAHRNLNRLTVLALNSSPLMFDGDEGSDANYPERALSHRIAELNNDQEFLQLVGQASLIRSNGIRSQGMDASYRNVVNTLRQVEDSPNTTFRRFLDPYFIGILRDAIHAYNQALGANQALTGAAAMAANLGNQSSSALMAHEAPCEFLTPPLTHAEQNLLASFPFLRDLYTRGPGENVFPLVEFRRLLQIRYDFMSPLLVEFFSKESNRAAVRNAATLEEKEAIIEKAVVKD